MANPSPRALRRRTVASGLALLVVVGAAGCSKDPNEIADPASVDLSGVAPLSALDCVDLTLAHSDFVQARSSADAQGPLDAMKRFDPPGDVLHALEYSARYAGDIRKGGEPTGVRAYDLAVKWKRAACPVPADRGEGDSAGDPGATAPASTTATSVAPQGPTTAPASTASPVATTAG